MDRGLKERLVGAAVLAALAVIFIPMLLDDAPSGPGPITETNIPEQPAETDSFSSRIIPVEPSPAELPSPPAEPAAETEAAVSEPAPAAEGQAPAVSETVPGTEAREESAQTAESGESGDPAALTKAMPPPQTDEATPAAPSGWIIQLGSFAKEDNARDLNGKLQKAGYASFVEPVKQSGQTVYRVRVGPEVMRGDAEKLRDRIAAKFDLKGIVVRHRP